MYSMLLVDDETATREGLVRLPLWRRLGISRILQAQDGMDALKVLEHEQPDILLTDVKMPRMEGTELAKRARAMYGDIKIVFISGYDDIGYVKSALAVAAYDYIFKPVALAELESCFERVVNSLNTERNDRRELDRLIERGRAGERILRDHLLGIMLTSPPLESDALDEALLLLNVPEQGRHMTVLAIHAVGPGGQVAVIDTLTPDGLQSYAYVIDHRKGLYALVLETRQAFSSSHLTNIAKEVLENLRMRAMPAYAAIGIDTQGTGQIELLGAHFRMAQEALSHCIYQPAFSIQAYHIFPVPEKTQTRPQPLEERELLDSQDAPLENWLAALEAYLVLSQRTDIAFYVRQFSRWVDYIDTILARHFRLDPEMDELSPIKALDAIMEAPCVPQMMAQLKTYCYDVRNILLHENDATMRQSIQRAVRYIHAHFSEPLTIQELAAHAYISPAYLSMLFRRELDLTVNAYITKVRMERAKVLLLDPAMKQYDISIAIGYANPGYFIRQFKKYAGVTPAEFRNRNLVDEP